MTARNEREANAALVDTVRLRILKDGEDPNEGEPMSVADRRRRQAEARALHALHKILDVPHTWRGRPDFTNTKRYHK